MMKAVGDSVVRGGFWHTMGACRRHGETEDAEEENDSEKFYK